MATRGVQGGGGVPEQDKNLVISVQKQIKQAYRTTADHLRSAREGGGKDPNWHLEQAEASLDKAMALFEEHKGQFSAQDQQAIMKDHESLSTSRQQLMMGGKRDSAVSQGSSRTSSSDSGVSSLSSQGSIKATLGATPLADKKIDALIGNIFGKTRVFTSVKSDLVKMDVKDLGVMKTSVQGASRRSDLNEAFKDKGEKLAAYEKQLTQETDPKVLAKLVKDPKFQQLVDYHMIGLGYFSESGKDETSHIEALAKLSLRAAIADKPIPNHPILMAARQSDDYITQMQTELSNMPPFARASLVDKSRLSALAEAELPPHESAANFVFLGKGDLDILGELGKTPKNLEDARKLVKELGLALSNESLAALATAGFNQSPGATADINFPPELKGKLLALPEKLMRAAENLYAKGDSESAAKAKVAIDLAGVALAEAKSSRVGATSLLIGLTKFTKPDLVNVQRFVVPRVECLVNSGALEEAKQLLVEARSIIDSAKSRISKESLQPVEGAFSEALVLVNENILSPLPVIKGWFTPKNEDLYGELPASYALKTPTPALASSIKEPEDVVAKKNTLNAIKEVAFAEKSHINGLIKACTHLNTLIYTEKDPPTAYEKGAFYVVYQGLRDSLAQHEKLLEELTQYENVPGKENSLDAAASCLNAALSGETREKIQAIDSSLAALITAYQPTISKYDSFIKSEVPQGFYSLLSIVMQRTMRYELTVNEALKNAQKAGSLLTDDVRADLQESAGFAKELGRVADEFQGQLFSPKAARPS